jgi:uroporphyrinogen III methyltransferase/synthase
MARIVVTRPRERASTLVTRLESLGHEVVVCPLIELEPLGDDPVDVGGYDWVIVTSPFGARELRRRSRGRMPKVAAIGEATAEAFGGVDLVPRVSTQEGLLAELPRPTGRVLFAGAAGARQLVVDELAADFLPLYRTRELAASSFPQGDLVVLASPSAARALRNAGSQSPVVTIGPETTREAVRCGLVVAAEAQTHDVDGLVAAVQLAAAP